MTVHSSQKWHDLNIVSTNPTDQVIATIYAVSSVASSEKGYEGPSIGTKIAEKNEREFDEATLNAGKFVLGGQMGYTEGESQSGMNIGKTRKVVDL